MQKIKKIFISHLAILSLFCFVLFPILVSAQGTSTGGSTSTSGVSTGGATTPPAPFCPGGFDTIGHIFNFFTCLITGSIIPLLMSIATIMFIWGVIQYVINAEDSAKREEGRSFIIWGIIGLFVLVSIWGIIKLLTGTFGFNSATLVIPQLQSQ